jgi:hypothetical protein
MDAGTLAALAPQSCAVCKGKGQTVSGGACRCSLRAITRACVRRWRDSWISPRIERHRNHWARPEENFRVDLELVSSAALSGDELKIFRLVHFYGCDWRLGCRKLKLEKGRWFQLLYAAEAKVGRACWSAGVYPLDQYFSPAVPAAA